MNIDILKVFYKTIYYSSISIAAKELFLSQPAVSMQIKALEKELNLTLLDRSNKGVAPTEAGKVIYRYAEDILQLHENMLKDLKQINGCMVNRLTISCCSTLGQYSLPCSLYEFKKSFPDLDIYIEHAPSADVIVQVKDRGIDIGFIEGSSSDADIECIPMGSSFLHFVASPELIGKNVIKKEDLYKYNMFFIHRKCSLRRIIEENLANSDIDRRLLKISIESPSIESIKASIIAGQGISILPYLCIKKELYSKSLTIFEVENVKFPYSYSLIYKKKNVKLIKNEFINYMKSVGKDKLC